MGSKTLGQLAEYVGGKVCGDPKTLINSVSTLKRAGEGEISFLSNAKYTNQTKTTKASAIVVFEQFETNVPLLIVDDPYYAFTQIMVLLYGHRKHKKVGISLKMNISKTAKLGSNCHIHDFVTIYDNAAIGDGCIIYPGAFIGPNVHLGNDCIIYPNVVIYENCRIGNHVILNANSSIGEDGFGFATNNGVHHKIPQIGIVIIEDDVEIGTSCAIERGTLDDTFIGQGTKIGDLVTVGHGTEIGPHCLIVPQAGIAGSVKIGHHCILAGQVGIAGHTQIGNHVTIAAQSGVIKDIPDGQVVFGTPAIEAGLGKRAYSMIRYLPQMRKSIRQLEKQLMQEDLLEQ